MIGEITKNFKTSYASVEKEAESITEKLRLLSEKEIQDLAPIDTKLQEVEDIFSDQIEKANSRSASLAQKAKGYADQMRETATGPAAEELRAKMRWVIEDLIDAQEAQREIKAKVTEATANLLREKANVAQGKSIEAEVGRAYDIKHDISTFTNELAEIIKRGETWKWRDLWSETVPPVVLALLSIIVLIWKLVQLSRGSV